MNASKYPGYRTMTAAQRRNARQDRIWEAARAEQTRFNLASRESASAQLIPFVTSRYNPFPASLAAFAEQAKGPFSFVAVSGNATTPQTYLERRGNFTGHRLPCVVLAEDFSVLDLNYWPSGKPKAHCAEVR